MEAASKAAAVIDIARPEPAGNEPGRTEPLRSEPARCRPNSRRGLTDLSGSSYPPVEAAWHVLDGLRTVNELSIATAHRFHVSTRLHRPPASPEGILR